MDRLLGDREGAGDDRLAGDDGGEGGEDDEGDPRHLGGEQEEGVPDRLRRAFRIQRQDHRPLAHVVQHQGGHHEGEPGKRDRLAAEMPHVGIQRLGPGHGQHDRAHGEKRAQPVGQEEVERIERVQGVEDDCRVGGDVHDPEHRDCREVDQHDRAEKSADAARAMGLDREKPDQDDHRDGHNEGAEPWFDCLQPLDRGKHRDGGRDHAVAIEKRAGEHAEQDDSGRPSALRDLAADQREQCQAAAFALVVGPHDDADIFDRDHDHHRPEDQAQHSVDVQRVGRDRMMAGKGLAKGVDRAGANVAEHDPDRADRQLQYALPLMVLRAGAHVRQRSNSGRLIHGSLRDSSPGIVATLHRRWASAKVGRNQVNHFAQRYQDTFANKTPKALSDAETRRFLQADLFVVSARDNYYCDLFRH